MNSSQFNAMSYLSQHPDTLPDAFCSRFSADLVGSLVSNKWLYLHPKGDRYTITQAGYTAMEEYEAAQRSEQRDNESLRVAKRANNIAIGAAIAAAVAILLQVVELIVGVIG